MPAVASQPLRVLYVTQDDLSKNSGYALRVDCLRRELELAGAQVDVLGFCSGDAVIRSSARRTRSPLRRLWPLWRALIQPARCVVITSIGAPYNGAYAALQRLLGRRVVYDMHDPVRFSLPQVFGTGFWMRAAMPFIALSEKLLDACASATVAASSMARDLYKKAGWHGPISVMYNIREAAAAEPGRRLSIRERFGWAGSTIIVYAGGLQRNVRGIEAQIEAVVAARGRGADLALLLIGFGDRTFFEEYGAGLERESRLQILDDVPPGELAALLRECDVAISSEPVGYLMQSKYFDYLWNGVRVAAIDDGRELTRVLAPFVDTYDGTTGALVNYLAARPCRSSEDQIREARASIARLKLSARDGVAQIVRALSGTESA